MAITYKFIHIDINKHIYKSFGVCTIKSTFLFRNTRRNLKLNKNQLIANIRCLIKQMSAPAERERSY